MHIAFQNGGKTTASLRHRTLRHLIFGIARFVSSVSGLWVCVSISPANADSAVVWYDDGKHHVLEDTALGANGDHAMGIVVYGEGTSLTARDLKVTTDGDHSVGIYVRHGGRADLANINIEARKNAIGIRVSGDGGGKDTVVVGDNIQIISENMGVFVRGAGSLLTLTDTEIIAGGRGLGVSNSGTAYLSNFSILSGDDGVLVEIEGTATLEHGSIGTSGGGAHGLYALGGGQITASDVRIDTTGDAAMGVVANGMSDSSAGKITLSGVKVTTAGNQSIGMLALQSGSRIDATDVTVETKGHGAAGVLTVNGGVAAIERARVVTSGNLAEGLVAKDSGRMTVSKTTVKTTGEASHGVRVSTNGQVNLTDSYVNVVGVDASGLQVTNQGGDGVFPVPVSRIDITRTTVVSENGYGIGAKGGRTNINLASSNILGKLGLFHADAAPDNTVRTELNISANETILTGAGITNENAFTNMALRGQSVWHMTGSSNLTTLLNDSSSIVFSPPSDGGFKTLTVEDNYTGNNGSIVLHTWLGGDASPTDRFVVLGDTTPGTTLLTVRNAGAPGNQTVEGIKVVDVDGKSEGTFVLNGDYNFNGKPAVIAGVYAYQLYKNGVDTPDGDWYLRSELTPGNRGPGDPTNPEIPMTPIYQPGVPLYEAYPQVLSAFNRLSTLRQRVGNRSWSSLRGIVKTTPGSAWDEGGRQGIWGRIEAAHSHASSSFSTSATSYDTNLWRMQAGGDFALHESAAGSLIGGISGHFGEVTGKIRSLFGTGTISSRGYGLGGTLTWYGHGGFYLDAQTQATWFDSTLSSATLGRSLADGGNRAFGYALSIEGGQNVDLDQHWALTPQAQLTYAAVDFDRFADPFGAQVSLANGDSLKARVGLSVDYQDTWQDQSGSTTKAHLYSVASLHFEFLDGTGVDVSGVGFSNGDDPLSGSVGVGGTLSWADGKFALHGEGAITTSLDNPGDSFGVAGTVGFRMTW